MTMFIVFMLMFNPATEKTYRLADIEYKRVDNSTLCQQVADKFNNEQSPIVAADGTKFMMQAECLTNM